MRVRSCVYQSDETRQDSEVFAPAAADADVTRSTIPNRSGQSALRAFHYLRFGEGRERRVIELNDGLPTKEGSIQGQSA